jgi:hypothetical protein
MWQDRRERRRERRLAKAERLGRQQEIQASPEVYQQATRSAHLKSGGLVP